LNWCFCQYPILILAITMFSYKEIHMRNQFWSHPAAVIVTIGFLLSGLAAQTQERMTIQATARGTSTQMGDMQNVKIIVEEYSTAADQKALKDAFHQSGTQGIVAALEKMNSKGRIMLSGTTGNELKYVIELPSDKSGGRRLRLVTDRNISIAENRNSGRSTDYSLTAVDLTLMPEEKKSSGTLLPACQLKINKKTNEIEVETLQNPWKLTDFIVSKDNK
jgi:hypothetical protein